MKEPVFPDIDGAFTWYIVTKDGLRGLRAAIQCGAVLSEDIGDELYGMTLLLQLLTLFRQRNDLAHGRIAEDVAVERVYDLLCRIREKWCAAVPDFRGF